MEARICFDVYKDFSREVRKSIENGTRPHYAEAIEKLNKILENLVKKEELVFTYKNKKVNIILPLTLRDVENIYGPSLGHKESYWNNVQIPCNINCKLNDFNPKKLRAEKHPEWCDPIMISY